MGCGRARKGLKSKLELLLCNVIFTHVDTINGIISEDQLGEGHTDIWYLQQSKAMALDLAGGGELDQQHLGSRAGFRCVIWLCFLSPLCKTDFRNISYSPCI